VVSLVHSRLRLDYGNFILVGVPAYLRRRLQTVLNTAARLVFRLRRYDQVTDAFAILYWLRLPERVNLSLTTYRLEYCTVWRRRTFNSFRYQTLQVVAACGRRLHFSCCCNIHRLEFLDMFTSSLHHLS